MFKYSRLFKVILVIIAAVFMFTTISLLRYPYIAIAFTEGFPAPTWPAKGTFINVGSGAKKFPLPVEKDNTPTKRLQAIFNDSQGSSLLVVRNGIIELELNKTGVAKTTQFNSYSLVKSLMGALTFKAVADGKIKSLDESLASLHPGFVGSPLKTVTLRSLLDMTSAIRFEPVGSKAISVRQPKDLQKSFANPFGPMVELHFLGINEVLPHLVIDKTVTGQFNYQNINTAILSLILEQAYGEPINKILTDKIWNPANARQALWRKYGKNLNVTAYCCLYATTRDWARVAQFLMDNGSKDKPFLPQNLWNEFFGKNLKDDQVLKGAYANQTRYDILNRKGQALQGRFIYFMGHNGQVVYLMPEKNLIVIRFGEKPQLLHSTLYEVWNSIGKK